MVSTSDPPATDAPCLEPKRDKAKDVEDLLRCPLCKDIFVEPVTIRQCMHSFCGTCIEKATRRKHNCPTCRRRIVKSDLRQDQQLRMIVYKMAPWKFFDYAEKMKTETKEIVKKPHSVIKDVDNDPLKLSIYLKEEPIDMSYEDSIIKAEPPAERGEKVLTPASDTSADSGLVIDEMGVSSRKSSMSETKEELKLEVSADEDTLWPKSQQHLSPRVACAIANEICMPNEKISFVVEYLCQLPRRESDEEENELDDDKMKAKGSKSPGLKSCLSHKKEEAMEEEEPSCSTSGSPQKAKKIRFAKSVNNGKKGSNSGGHLFKRYFRCEAKVTIGAIRKIIEAKLRVPDEHKICFVAKNADKYLDDADTLHSLIIEHGFRRNRPFKIYFSLQKHKVQQMPCLTAEEPMESAPPALVPQTSSPTAAPPSLSSSLPCPLTLAAPSAQPLPNQVTVSLPPSQGQQQILVNMYQQQAGGPSAMLPPQLQQQQQPPQLSSQEPPRKRRNTNQHEQIVTVTSPEQSAPAVVVAQPPPSLPQQQQSQAQATPVALANQLLQSGLQLPNGMNPVLTLPNGQTLQCLAQVNGMQQKNGMVMFSMFNGQQFALPTPNGNGSPAKPMQQTQFIPQQVLNKSQLPPQLQQQLQNQANGGPSVTIQKQTAPSTSVNVQQPPPQPTITMPGQQPIRMQNTTTLPFRVCGQPITVSKTPGGQVYLDGAAAAQAYKLPVQVLNHPSINNAKPPTNETSSSHGQVGRPRGLPRMKRSKAAQAQQNQLLQHLHIQQQQQQQLLQGTQQPPQMQHAQAPPQTSQSHHHSPQNGAPSNTQPNQQSALQSQLNQQSALQNQLKMQAAGHNLQPPQASPRQQTSSPAARSDMPQLQAAAGAARPGFSPQLPAQALPTVSPNSSLAGQQGRVDTSQMHQLKARLMASPVQLLSKEESRLSSPAISFTPSPLPRLASPMEAAQQQQQRNSPLPKLIAAPQLPPIRSVSPDGPPVLVIEDSEEQPEAPVRRLSDMGRAPIEPIPRLSDLSGFSSPSPPVKSVTPRIRSPPMPKPGGFLGATPTPPPMDRRPLERPNSASTMPVLAAQQQPPPTKQLQHQLITSELIAVNKNSSTKPSPTLHSGMPVLNSPPPLFASSSMTPPSSVEQQKPQTTTVTTPMAAKDLAMQRKETLGVYLANELKKNNALRHPTGQQQAKSPFSPPPLSSPITTPCLQSNKTASAFLPGQGGLMMHMSQSQLRQTSVLPMPKKATSVVSPATTPKIPVEPSSS